ncbi:hypothetical protein ABW19_dt0200765 [Dactylella cylindrospora]|nr:hypothetical protein ABW19_dt0200765 [Dactylella cylindrospora]
MSKLVHRRITEGARECHRSQGAYETAFGYVHGSCDSKYISGWDRVGLELINESSKGRLPHVLRPTLTWEIEQLSLLEELRRLEGNATTRPTKVTYKAGEFCLFADDNPHIMFQNGNYIQFETTGYLVVRNRDNECLATVGVDGTGYFKSELSISMWRDGYLRIHRQAGQAWYSSPGGAATLVCQQTAPYITALNDKGTVIWTIPKAG